MPRPHTAPDPQLDPELLDFVRAMARRAAQADHRRETETRQAAEANSEYSGK